MTVDRMPMKETQAGSRRSAAWRTALVLGSIAAAFFIGIIVKKGLLG